MSITSEQFMQIIMSIITLLGILITSAVLPYIRSKISAEELDKLSYYITVAVRCAEQIYTPEQWRDKKAYVMSYIRQIIDSKLSISLTDEQLDTIVEGIVNEIKHGVTDND